MDHRHLPMPAALSSNNPKLCTKCGADAGDRGLRRSLCNRCYTSFRKAAKKAGVFIPVTPPLALHDRLMHTTAIDPSGCLLWTGRINRKGYGQISVGNRKQAVHRVAYEAMVAPIPDGMMLDHACHNADTTCQGGNSCLHRRCIHPDHLEPTSHRENQLRSAKTLPGAYSRAESCINGHPFDGSNTRLDPKGRRVCRQCERDRLAARRASVKAAIVPCGYVGPHSALPCARPIGHSGPHKNIARVAVAR